jgi:hypothetical protein
LLPKNLSANLQNYCISLIAREEVHFNPGGAICRFSEIYYASNVFLSIPIILFLFPPLYFQFRVPFFIFRRFISVREVYFCNSFIYFFFPLLKLRLRQNNSVRDIHYSVSAVVIFISPLADHFPSLKF